MFPLATLLGLSLVQTPPVPAPVPVQAPGAVAPAPKGVRATLELQANWTETELAPGGEATTRRFLLKTPCRYSAGAPAGMAQMPAFAADLVPGVAGLYSFPVDKDREAEMSANFSEQKRNGVELVHEISARLKGPLNGTLSFAATGKSDELVLAVTSLFTGFFVGSSSSSGAPMQEYREAAGLVYLPSDLMNPMDPDAPRASFSRKALEEGLASGKPFDLAASKDYDLSMKGKHYRGSYSVTLHVTP